MIKALLFDHIFLVITVVNTTMLDNENFSLGTPENGQGQTTVSYGKFQNLTRSTKLMVLVYLGPASFRHSGESKTVQLGK